MRKLLLIGLLILCYTDGITQKITLSEKEELNMRDDDFMVIGNVGTGGKSHLKDLFGIPEFGSSSANLN